ncbi:MAG: DNA polymerase IV [Patescibacteria group bacterium]|jgi:DNA polymerase-4
MEKIIFHIDMDSYFATCEQQANPFLRGKPIAVSGHPDSRTVVSAASKEAKKLGVKSAMPIYEARRICPEIIFVPGDFEKYVHITKKIISIFLSFTDQVEVTSIDEAFMDVTPIAKRYGGAISVANKIKMELKKQVGEWMTCSIGIAPNKLMAKLASGLKKPDGVMQVPQKDILSVLKTIELTDLCGLGRQTEKHLNRIGIKNLVELRQYPLTKLIKEFGQTGLQLYNMSWGRGSDDVPSYYDAYQEKSMGHQITLPKNTLDLEYLNNTLLKLCEKTGRRMREAGLAGRVVSVFIRYNNFEGISRQKAVRINVDDGYQIFEIARNILKSFSFKYPVRLIGVSVAKLSPSNQSLLPFADTKKKQAILQAMDIVNNKHGEFTIQRACLLKDLRLKRDLPAHGLMRKYL